MKRQDDGCEGHARILGGEDNPPFSLGDWKISREDHLWHQHDVPIKNYGHPHLDSGDSGTGGREVV